MAAAERQPLADMAREKRGQPAEQQQQQHCGTKEAEEDGCRARKEADCYPSGAKLVTACATSQDSKSGSDRCQDLLMAWTSVAVRVCVVARDALATATSGAKGARDMLAPVAHLNDVDAADFAARKRIIQTVLDEHDAGDGDHRYCHRQRSAEHRPAPYGSVPPSYLEALLDAPPDYTATDTLARSDVADACAGDCPPTYTPVAPTAPDPALCSQQLLGQPRIALDFSSSRGVQERAKKKKKAQAFDWGSGGGGGGNNNAGDNNNNNDDGNGWSQDGGGDGTGDAGGGDQGAGGGGSGGNGNGDDGKDGGKDDGKDEGKDEGKASNKGGGDGDGEGGDGSKKKKKKKNNKWLASDDWLDNTEQDKKENEEQGEKEAPAETPAEPPAEEQSSKEEEEIPAKPAEEVAPEVNASGDGGGPADANPDKEWAEPKKGKKGKKGKVSA